MPSEMCRVLFFQELETTDPNFIVVYDLQSGTLFKKWKAGANTVAVSIGCQNSCVVTSLQDARILVWDLGTGNYSYQFQSDIQLSRNARIEKATVGGRSLATRPPWTL